MIDIKELLKAGVHFGHRTSKWSPKMGPYIWGAKNKIHLIDIAKTSFLLDRACKYLQEVSSEGKPVLWIGTKKAARDIIKKTAMDLEMPYVIHRWIGGTLSNFGEIKKAITRLLHLRDVLERSSTRHMSKKEISALQKEVGRLERNIGGILDLTSPPAAVIIVDAKKEHAALKEALGLKIPIVSMVDTNTDPTNINFVIPSNDDATRSIKCIISKLSEAVTAGKEKYEEEHKEEIEAKKAAKAKKLAAQKRAADRAHREPRGEREEFQRPQRRQEKNVQVDLKVKTPTEKIVPKEEPKKEELKETITKAVLRPAPAVAKAMADTQDERKEVITKAEVSKTSAPKEAKPVTKPAPKTEKIAPKVEAKKEEPVKEKKEEKAAPKKATTTKAATTVKKTTTTSKKTTVKKPATTKKTVTKKASPAKKSTTKKSAPAKTTTTKKKTTTKKVTTKRKVASKKAVKKS